MSERIQQLCVELSLNAVATHYANLADEAAHKERSFVEYLEQVLDVEAALRAERSREVLRRLAGFPSVKTIEQFDFEAGAGAPKARIQELTGLAFVERRENVILLGPSGTGKTHLAIAEKGSVRSILPGCCQTVRTRLGDSDLKPVVRGLGNNLRR